jgi:5-enolpyruvylshikimate-3-phosphate synthase
LLILGVKGIDTVCSLYNFHKFDKAQFLLEHGIKKEDALIKAAHADYFVACKHLVMEGADIHVQNERPLQLAVQQGNFSIIKLLVENDASINKYVLLAACTAADDRADIIEYLIKNLPNKMSFNNDLISLAQKVGNFKIYNFLKEVIALRFIQ